MAAEVEFPELRARMIAAVDALAKPYAPGRSLAELASLLQSVWDETEKYASNPALPTDDEFQRAPSWPKAIESARRARDSLLQ